MTSLNKFKIKTWTSKHKLVDWLVGCKYESNCPLGDPGTIGGVPSLGVFIRDPSAYLREIRKKTRKTLND